MDLYTLLNVDRTATQEEIHSAYKALSTCFHPDKLPPSAAVDPQQREHIEQTFLDCKRANDILMDPVLRLAYDYYEDEGVELLKRLQQQRKDRQTRREVELEQDSDQEDDDEEEESQNLYDKLTKLLLSNQKLQAKNELQRFMEQHEYHEQLQDDHQQVQLDCNLEFPPVIDLQRALYRGRNFLQYAQRSVRVSAAQSSPGEHQYFQKRLQEEQGLVDYQMNQLKNAQSSEVGFTLTSTAPRLVKQRNGQLVPPKWSMVWGATTRCVYPGVTKLNQFKAQKPEGDQRHPASTFCNCVYQPIPNSQISMTANLSNDQSHQFVLGSSRNFSNRTAMRWDMTWLSKSPLGSPLICNCKTFRHIANIGMASGGLSIGGNGDLLQWHAKWEAMRSSNQLHDRGGTHKISTKVSMGRLQGNSVDVSYKYKLPSSSKWDDYLALPRKLELGTSFGRFNKVTGMLTQEFTSLAGHPSLAFGMEHEIGLACWTWVWEWTHHNSTFRVPIPVVHFGSISDPSRYYGEKIYYAVYCILLQSLVADLLQDEVNYRRPHMSTNDLDRKKEKIPMVSTRKQIVSKQKLHSEAVRQMQMMEPVADRKRFEERRKKGLVILQATYWLEVQDAETESSSISSMDATQQLQFWVNSGRLVVPAIPKSAWLGFYDLRSESKVKPTRLKRDWRFWKFLSRQTSVRPIRNDPQPKLTVRYSHAGYVYEATLDDVEAQVIPFTGAQLLGHEDVVR